MTVSKRNEAYVMMAECLNGNLPVSKFADEYCMLYNFASEFDYNVLTTRERFWFSELGDITARYSNYPEDFILYPKVYFSDDDVKQVITAAYAELVEDRNS